MFRCACAKSVLMDGEGCPFDSRVTFYVIERSLPVHVHTLARMGHNQSMHILAERLLDACQSTRFQSTPSTMLASSIDKHGSEELARASSIRSFPNTPDPAETTFQFSTCHLQAALSNSLKMPFVHVSSNVPASSVDTARAIRELSESLMAALDAPQSSTMVQLSLDQPMLFAGSDAVRFVSNNSISSASPCSCTNATLCYRYCMLPPKQPCAFVLVRSIGKIGNAEHNSKTAQVLTASVAELLGVPTDRVFMNFDSISVTNWGARGTTVDKLQKK